MKHFILTIFNEVFPDVSSYGLENKDLGIQEDWLQQRLKLFLKITDPSIRSQTNGNFTWLIKCHHLTPAWAKKELEKCCGVLDYSEPPWHESLSERFYDSIYEHSFYSNRVISRYSFQKSINKLIKKDDSIITTRLDSDDGLASNYVELIQERSKPGRFIDFCKGLVITKDGIFLYSRHQRHPSQFCSYMELINENYKIKTVYFLHHTLANPCDYYDEIGWIQINHNLNLNNNKINLNLIPYNDLKCFKFKIDKF